ncbi:hypothetical protein [Xanthomonas theicola]|uniref:hypothetical protein n=1 Tax=Xanthomonas theicola TaxID=56464 RepID=UPI003CCD1F87
MATVEVPESKQGWRYHPLLGFAAKKYLIPPIAHPTLRADRAAVEGGGRRRSIVGPRPPGPRVG